MSVKIYLIANNGSLTDNHINLLNLSPDKDIVVLFNYMCVPYSSLKCIQNKIIFLRVVYHPHSSNAHYLGGVEFLDIQTDFTKVICVDDYGKYQEFASSIIIPHEKLDIEQFLKIYFKDINYTDCKIPTTGFIAYLYMKSMYPLSEIILVGFTGHNADGTIPDNKHHDYTWEQAYYKESNVKRV